MDGVLLLLKSKETKLMLLAFGISWMVIRSVDRCLPGMANSRLPLLRLAPCCPNPKKTYAWPEQPFRVRTVPKRPSLKNFVITFFWSEFGSKIWSSLISLKLVIRDPWLICICVSADWSPLVRHLLCTAWAEAPTYGRCGSACIEVLHRCST